MALPITELGPLKNYNNNDDVNSYDSDDYDNYDGNDDDIGNDVSGNSAKCDMSFFDILSIFMSGNQNNNITDLYKKMKRHLILAMWSSILMSATPSSSTSMLPRSPTWRTW